MGESQRSLGVAATPRHSAYGSRCERALRGRQQQSSATVNYMPLIHCGRHVEAVFLPVNAHFISLALSHQQQPLPHSTAQLHRRRPQLPLDRQHVKGREAAYQTHHHSPRGRSRSLPLPFTLTVKPVLALPATHLIVHHGRRLARRAVLETRLARRQPRRNSAASSHSQATFAAARRAMGPVPGPSQ